MQVNKTKRKFINYKLRDVLLSSRLFRSCVEATILSAHTATGHKNALGIREISQKSLLH